MSLPSCNRKMWDDNQFGFIYRHFYDRYTSSRYYFTAYLIEIVIHVIQDGPPITPRSGESKIIYFFVNLFSKRDLYQKR